MRISQEDKALWQEQADKDGVRLAEWVRSVCASVIESRNGATPLVTVGRNAPPPFDMNVLRNAAAVHKMALAKAQGVGQPKKKGFCRGACERKTACPAGECKNA